MTIQDCKDYVVKLLACGTIFSQLNITESAVTAFGSLKPSNPSFIREWDNITLKWNYSIDGSIGQALFLNGTDDAAIAAKFGDAGDTNVASSYQERFRADISNTLAQLTILTVRKSDRGKYKFALTTTKFIALSDEVELIVQYPADIIHISGNQTVNETDVVTLTCSAEGIPSPNITWTRISDNSPVSFPLTITGKQEEGGYRCTADNGIGNPASQNVYVIVQNYHPINTNLRSNLINNAVVVNTSFNITCSSEGNPAAKYRFYKDQDNFVNDTTGSDVSVITTTVIERMKMVNYSCTPFNDFGDGLTDGLTLTVLCDSGKMLPNRSKDGISVSPSDNCEDSSAFLAEGTSVKIFAL